MTYHICTLSNIKLFKRVSTNCMYIKLDLLFITLDRYDLYSTPLTDEERHAALK